MSAPKLREKTASAVSCNHTLTAERLERLGNLHRPVRELIIFQKSDKESGGRERGIVERMHKAGFPLRVLVSDVEPTRLKIMEIGRGMGLAVFTFGRNITLDIVFFYLSQPQIASAVHDDMVRHIERLKHLLRVFRQFLMEGDRGGVVRFAKYHLLKLEKLMHAENAFSVFTVASGLATETGRERES